MNNCHFDKSYIDWINNFLYRNDSFIRLYDSDYFINITEEDELKSSELFMFFSKLLRYSSVHNISNNILEEDISNEFKETFLCFDCSLVIEYKEYFINIIVLELGGSSDMIIRHLTSLEKISKKNIIDFNDFESWLNDYEYGIINCFNCDYLEEIKVDYKVSGIDYKCSKYGDMCNREYGILSKNKDRIHPSPLCRRDKHSQFNNKIK